MSKGTINRKVTYNAVQMAFRHNNRKYKTLVGGRGLGKTTMEADELEVAVHAMPRSRLFLVGRTYVQILTLELPPIKAHWARLGYYQNVHYFVGKRPPKSWLRDWPTAYHMPENLDHCIWWYNGTIIQLISFDRKDTGSRGGSFDGGIRIESALLPKQRLDNELTPAIRSTDLSLKDHPKNGFVTDMTTMPITPSGDWVFDAEKKQEEEEKKILGVAGFAEYHELKKKKDYQHKSYRKHLRKLKQHASEREYLYMEATARYNTYILGKDWFRRQKQNMHPLIYDVEIENKRMRRLVNGFYPQFSDKKHVKIDTFRYEHIDQLEYDHTKFENDCRHDADLVHGVPLQVSFDFNGGIYSALVFQYLQSVNTVRFLKNFFVKDGVELPELVGQIVEYYSSHAPHFIKIWGDRNGHFRIENRASFYDDVINAFHKAGWKTELLAPSKNIPHDLRYLIINRMLAGTEKRLPQIEINGNHCKELIISIENAPLEKATKGIKKDKSSENDQSLPQEHATHFSDCFDYGLQQFFESIPGSRSLNDFSIGFMNT